MGSSEYKRRTRLHGGHNAALLGGDHSVLVERRGGGVGGREDGLWEDNWRQGGRVKWRRGVIIGRR